MGQPDALIYPDVVLAPLGRPDKPEIVVEVETGESVNNLEAMAEWLRMGRLKVAFHLYVPTGSVDPAKRLCTEHNIPVAEIWTFHPVGDQMRFTMVYKAPESAPGREASRARARAGRQAGGRRPGPAATKAAAAKKTEQESDEARCRRPPPKKAATSRKEARQGRKRRRRSAARTVSSAESRVLSSTFRRRQDLRLCGREPLACRYTDRMLMTGKAVELCRTGRDLALRDAGRPRAVGAGAEADGRPGPGPGPDDAGAEGADLVPQVVPPQPTPPALFRSGIEMVTTDVITRDTSGQFVADLKSDEFEVYEDGVKQDVVQLLLFHGGRQYSPLAAPVQTQREGIVLPPPRPTNDAAGRIFVFFLDDLHLDFRNTGRIKELVKKIRQQLVHDGDMFCIVSTGPSSIAIDMTYNLKRLDEAMTKISGAGLRPNEIVDSADGRRGAARGALPRARGVLDRVRPAGTARADPQPAQGVHLHQQRLRLQPVRRLDRCGGEAERENPGSTEHELQHAGAGVPERAPTTRACCSTSRAPNSPTPTSPASCRS